MTPPITPELTHSRMPDPFSRDLTRPLLRPAPGTFAVDFDRDESAIAALRAESAQGRGHRGLYDLFQEMEDKDGHYYAVLQTRKNGVLARDRQVVPADDTPAASEAARLVRRLLADIPAFEQGLLSLLDALAKGFAVVEILWKINADGTIGVEELRGCPQDLFVFTRDGALRYLAAPGLTPFGYAPPPSAGERSAPESILTPPGAGIPCGAPVAPPERKFLVLSFGSARGNPYGKGLALKCYWYYWFKKHNLKFWAIYNERFGAPAVVGKYAAGASDEERRRLLEVIEALQSDTGVTLPEGMGIEFLEARRSGDGATYRDFADWCNDEMSKIVLGATLTASEGRRTGSLALGEIHQRVRSEYVEADAKLLMEVINRSLIPWLVRFNLGPGVPAPRWEIDTRPDSDLRAEAEIDRSLVAMGVPLPLSHFYRYYGRPEPRPGEKALRYDDANLYQYHLQFGVLTINEVRSALGLPPVAWGDAPPQAASGLSGSAASDAKSNPSGRLRNEYAQDPKEHTGDARESEAEPAE